MSGTPNVDATSARSVSNASGLISSAVVNRVTDIAKNSTRTMVSRKASTLALLVAIICVGGGMQMLFWHHVHDAEDLR